GLLTDDDVDNPINTFQADSGTGDNGHGTWSIDGSGSWSYTVDESDGAVDALNVGGTLTDTFTVTTEDGTPQLVTIDIAGANDAATFSGDDTGDVTEDGAVPGNPDAIGTLVVDDVDSSTDVVAQDDVATTYGHFTIDAGGSWTYDLDNANPDVDALNDAS